MPVIIVGANEEAVALARQFLSSPSAGMRIVGFVDDGLPVGAEVMEGLKNLGPMNSLRCV